MALDNAWIRTNWKGHSHLGRVTSNVHLKPVSASFPFLFFILSPLSLMESSVYHGVHSFLTALCKYSSAPFCGGQRNLEFFMKIIQIYYFRSIVLNTRLSSLSSVFVEFTVEVMCFPLSFALLVHWHLFGSSHFLLHISLTYSQWPHVFSTLMSPSSLPLVLLFLWNGFIFPYSPPLGCSLLLLAS